MNSFVGAIGDGEEGGAGFRGCMCSTNGGEAVDLQGEEGGRLGSAVGDGGLRSAIGKGLGFLSFLSSSPEINDKEGA